MLFDNEALKSLKQQFNSEKERKEGVVRATERGFGFLDVDRESYFISPDDMRKVVSGDTVSAVMEHDQNGRDRAVPEKLITPGLERFVANAVLSKDKYFVIPDVTGCKIRMAALDKRADKDEPIKSGDFLICTLESHALRDGTFRAAITERICAKDDPRAPWNVSLRSYDLPLVEPPDEDFSFLESELPREDLRQLCFVTIDSAHTEDMDDALYIERSADGYLLYVAIADPTGYVKEGSPLDQNSAKRGFSIYLPGRDIPMLPRCLSDQLCSLREGEERPALVGIFKVSAQGEIALDDTIFKLATIQSHGKLVYDEVSDFLEGAESAAFKPTPEVEGVLRLLTEYAQARESYRSEHAALFRNHPDYEFILNDQGGLDHIEIAWRRTANKIVEECMISANVAAGHVLAKHFDCGIFNTHKGLDRKKKNEILELIRSVDYESGEEELFTLEGYNKLRRFALAQSDEYLDNRIRRLQEYSVLSNEPKPHFALGVEHYATWTSPIRKYGDMINHRLLKSLAAGLDKPTVPAAEELKQLNLAKKENRMVERDVCDWLYIDYLKPDIEKKTVFEAELFDVLRGGLKVSLLDNGAKVFIPFSFLTRDRDALTLDGDQGVVLVQGKSVMRLGDHLKVRIVEIDDEARNITAAPTEGIGGLMLPEPKPKQAADNRGTGRRR
ncbi:MAG: exoribonuclease II [Succinivibrio sp.]|nr:exoribonuclease II [Succinivibrio sp.]